MAATRPTASHLSIVAVAVARGREDRLRALCGVAGVGLERPELGADVHPERQVGVSEHGEVRVAAREPARLPCAGVVGQKVLAAERPELGIHLRPEKSLDKG
jgi:hypothetical protein